MIICFSGTGNTRYIADRLHDLLGDEVLRLPPGLMKRPEMVTVNVTDGRLIWAFPVHCWAPPHTVSKVMRRATITSETPVTHHLVCTCGDDIGLADKIWLKNVKKRGWTPGHIASAQMPNTYTSLPGFDVDSKEVADAKIEAVGPRIEAIAADITGGNWGVDVVRGSYPWIKTRTLYPLFRAFLSSTDAFHTNDKCKGCGICMRNCPMISIQIVDSKPVWSKECNMCMRCYHCCPARAIEYGPFTKGKGQYICPGFSLKR